ncbi:hypothetical protein AHF37_02349 [Paragonimus kellicotti]|nr:hypothetical protein AHF37_02349 [Paragonimus kellicotti]
MICALSVSRYLQRGTPALSVLSRVLRLSSLADSPQLFSWLPKELEPEFMRYKKHVLSEYERLSSSISSGHGEGNLKRDNIVAVHVSGSKGRFGVKFDSPSTTHRTLVRVDISGISLAARSTNACSLFPLIRVCCCSHKHLSRPWIAWKDVLNADQNEHDREELSELVHLERQQRNAYRQALERQLLQLVAPFDPTSYVPGVCLELIAGAGGREAGLFARDLLEMYRLLAVDRGWRFQIVQESNMIGDESTSSGSEVPLSKARVEIVGDPLDVENGDCRCFSGLMDNCGGKPVFIGFNGSRSLASSTKFTQALLPYLTCPWVRR